MTTMTSRMSEAQIQPARDASRWILTAVLMALLVILPFVAPGYWIYFAGLLGINIIAAQGLNIMMGYTGLLSLGHAAFVGVGAYTVALLQTHFDLPFWIALPLAGVAAAVIGVGFGLPSLRIRGLYLVIATLAAQFILQFTFVNWQWLTNGDVGLPVRPAALFGFAFNNETRIYYLILAVMILLMIFANNVIRSRAGRAFVAIRERDLTAQVLGVEIVRYKLLAFALGSFYAGIAGGLLAYFNQYVNPEQFGLLLSVFFLSAVIVGGMGTILGAILGSIFMTLLPEVLRELSLLAGATLGYDLGPILTPLREAIFGVLIVGFLLLEPRGLAQLWRRVSSAISRSRT
ncbi:MAG: branched-chain amino acid ABC transporter permease [Rhizobiaceae bacterium]|nr:branched-chain amino acid ABC transporter permease [Rhizobiaceae bacterium]